MDTHIKNECFINGVLYRCRTCFDPGSAVYSLEDECSDKKTWRDLLKEVAQLETHEDEHLPNTVCSKCLDRLIVFYDFILQIKSVNTKYMELLASSTNPLSNLETYQKNDSSSDGFDEFPIDMPMEEFISEIKIEKEEITPHDIILSNNENDTNISSIRFEELKSTLDYGSNQILNDNPNKSRYSFSDEDDNVPLKVFKIEKKKSSTESTSLYKPSIPTVKGIKTIPFRNQQIERKNLLIPSGYKFEQVNNRFVCPICKQTFSFQRNCRRHMHLKHINQTKFHCGFCGLLFRSRDYLYRHLKRVHPSETVDTNTKYLERLFGNRLYSKPTAWSHVECKLCATTLTTTKELRSHLEIHSNVDTLQNLQMNDIIIQHLFPNINDLNIVKQSIVKDISEKNYFKYYSVLNEYRYEMSISDTEEEDLLEETTERAVKYKCELCDEEFSFKYQVFSHLQEKHSKEKIALKCSICKLEFISTKMYEQHLQTHCYNNHKVFHCKSCPGRFIWSENVKNHFCALNTLHIPEIIAQVDISETPVKDAQVKINTKNVKLSKSKNYDLSVKIFSDKAIIRCALCAHSFKKLSQLHQHMPLHADGKTGIDFKDCLYVNTFKRSKSFDQAHLQKQIQKAYSKAQISLFYQAIDKQGNELHISDSDSSVDESNSDENVKNQYMCEVCKEIFKQRKVLLKHQQEHHNNEELPFSCKNCNKQYVNSQLLQQHLKRLCWNENRRKAKQCEYCKDRFIWEYSMSKHMKLQHPKPTRPSNSASTTTAISKNSSLTVTPTITVSKDDFLHNDKLSITTKLLLEPSFLYYCLMCPKKFFTIEHLNDHLLNHRLTPIEMKAVESIVHSTWWPNGEKIIKCKICDLTFETMAKLKQHFSPTNLENFCADQHSLANYSITNQKGFELHLELDSETETEDEHNGTDTNTLFPYNCCRCNMSFKRKYQVSQHQRSMHNYELLELKCERCIFRTISQKILFYHKATQCFNIEKEYQCHHCNFKFMWKENLDNHILSFHTLNELTATTNADNTAVSNETVRNSKNSDADIVKQSSSNTTSNFNDCKEPTSSSNIKEQ